MTLRARLLLASAIIVVVVSVGAVVILRAQADFLTAQLDDQLRAARPLFRVPPTDIDTQRPIEALPPPDEPVSNLFVAVIVDGALEPILQGQLLDDIPDVDLDAAALGRAAGDDPFTVEGRAGTTRFRVAVMQTEGTDAFSVVALPLDEVDDAIERLRWALGGAIATITTVLVITLWWVERLGLRPVARVTAVADAIARGDRTRRVDHAEARTEAGRLGAAFNVMLDERDADEERLRRFVADASHELRTPLTSIRGYLDLYRDGGFRGNGQLDDVVRRMSQEASRMHELVEDLLLLAKLDEHRPLRHEDVDLARLLRDAAADAQVLQPRRQITLDLDDAPIEVTGDAFRLQQVVGILVDNVLVHTDVDVELLLGARSTQHGVELTVADTGFGLEPADAARVFDRFYRGDRSRTRTTGGSGLGLAIAKSIVEAHGGSIVLDTAPGRGCTFRIVLPQLPAGPGRAAGPSSRSPTVAATT
jgi:two-component system, OmpR family, sensor kinase